MTGPIVIRPAETTADYLACQVAQRLAWGITDDSYVVPLATLVGAQHHGGLVLGAFEPEGRALGLSFAFLGRVGGRPCLYSQLTGVIPGQQGGGLGGRLKAAQRDFAREQGLPCLAWSFDPLRAGNARFNLARLGAVATRYIPDMYGRRSDALNLGGPSDRLIVEWDSDPSPDPPPSVRFEDALGWPQSPAGPGAFPDGPRIVLEIPADLGSLRHADPEAAEGRTLGVRRGFVEAFARGYRADGFVQGDDAGTARAFYLLSRA